MESYSKVRNSTGTVASEVPWRPPEQQSGQCGTVPLLRGTFSTHQLAVRYEYMCLLSSMKGINQIIAVPIMVY